MKKHFYLFSFFILNFCFLNAQSDIEWQKTFGGTIVDVAQCIQQTNDGGYIVAGNSDSNDSDVTGNHGNQDVWIIKIDANGNLQWQKTFGGTDIDGAECIKQTNDGGYIVAGYTYSNDSDVTGNHGYFDCWVIKIDAAGILQWQKSYGGSNNEYAYYIEKTTDGGYILAGSSDSNDGDVTGNHGRNDDWIIKIDVNGNLQWQKSLGGTSDDYANYIQQTNDGGYIVAGFSFSILGGVPENHGDADYWIVKLNNLGAVEWQKPFGGYYPDVATSIQQTLDGGYIVAGSTRSNDGDVSGNHSIEQDYWIVKLDSSGILQWQKTFGGYYSDVPFSIQQTIDGGYIVAGISNSYDGDVTVNHGNHGSLDAWIVKIDSSGILQWQKSFGGSKDDRAYFIRQTTDGGFIFTGFSYSADGDVTTNYGYSDVWIVKLSSTVNVNEIQNSILDLKVSPNPFLNETNLSFNLSHSNKFIIEISDIEGRIIKNNAINNLSDGRNKFLWDATNNTGIKVDAGIYFATITSENIRETKKVIVLKN